MFNAFFPCLHADPQEARGNVSFPGLPRHPHCLFIPASQKSKWFSGVVESGPGWIFLCLVPSSRKVGGFSAVSQDRMSVVDHPKAEVGSRQWSRWEIISILRALRGRELKTEEEVSDLPLGPQVSHPLLFCDLKSYSLNFPWVTLTFWAGDSPGCRTTTAPT